MAKLDKTQREYILRRLSDEARKAIATFNAARPTSFAESEVREKLASKGFIIDSYIRGVTLPPSSKMEANKAAIAEFSNKVYAAQREAEDSVYLSDTDGAAEILKQFTDTLNKL